MRSFKPSFGKIRVPVGATFTNTRLLILALALHVAMIVAVAAQEAPRKLVSINVEANGTSTAIIAAAGETAVDADLGSDCGSMVEGFRLKLAAGEVARVTAADVQPYLCSDIALLNAPDVVTAYSIVTMPGAYSVAVPPLAAISGDQMSKMVPVLRDPDGGEFGAYVTVFPTRKDVTVPMFAKVYDGRSLFAPKVETFEARWPLTQYAIQASSSGAMFVQVGLGYSAFLGCWPDECSVFGNVYPLITSGKPAGGSLLVWPQ